MSVNHNSLQFNQNKFLWHLARLSGFGSVKLRQYLEFRDSIPELCSLDVFDLFCEQAALPNLFSDLLKAEISGSAFDTEVEKAAQYGVRFISIADSDYPKRLREIYDPPLVLYVKGEITPADDISIAMVGTRRPSLYGLRIAKQFSSELSERGITIVSGFALGIDGAAHQEALKRGRSIAVLGCGLDINYPAAHQGMRKDFEGRGAMISEYSFGTQPAAYNFPKRNRIISGLALGTLVIEANLRSGSLITATQALEEGREVFAVPGPIDSILSFGTNDLIKQGAKPALFVEDIMESLALKFEPIEKPAEIDASELEEGDLEVINLLEGEGLAFDELLGQTSIDRGKLLKRVADLESRHLIRRLYGGIYKTAVKLRVKGY